MEKVREFLISKKLCDNNFFLYIDNHIEFIDDYDEKCFDVYKKNYCCDIIYIYL